MGRLGWPASSSTCQIMSFSRRARYLSGSGLARLAKLEWTGGVPIPICTVTQYTRPSKRDGEERGQRKRTTRN